MLSSAQIIEGDYRPIHKPGFENFLIGRGEVAYLVHRLGRIISNRGLNYLLHLFEFFLISQSFTKGFPFVIAMRIGSILILNFWDGFLENKRIELQKLYSKNKIAEVATDWNTLAGVSIVIGALIGTIFFAAIYLMFHPGIRRLTILVILSAYIPVQFFLKAAHITVFAKRRVFIPANYFVYANFLIFILTFICRDFFGRNAYGFALITSSIFSCLLLARYIFKNFANLKISGNGGKKVTALHATRSNIFRLFGENNRLVISAKIISAIRESFLLIFIFLFFAHYTYLTDLYIYFYIIAPLLAYMNRWPRSFYYDLTTFKIDLFANFRLKVIYYLIITGLVIGSGLGLVSLLVARVIFSPEIFSAIHTSLLFLFIVGSVYSLLIANEFSKFHYHIIIVLEMLTLLSFTYFLFAENLYMLISYYTLPLAIFSAFLIAKNLKRGKLNFQTGHYRYNIEVHWLEALAKHLKNQPLIVLEILFAKNCKRSQVDLILSEISMQVPGADHLFVNKRRCYLNLPARNRAENLSIVISALHGKAQIVKLPVEIINFEELMTFLRDANDFPPRNDAKAEENSEEIDERFAEIFPQGIIIKPGKFSQSLALKFGPQIYAQMYKNFEHFLDPLLKGGVKLAGYAISALFQDGQIAKIYIIERARYDKNIIDNWAQYVKHTNLVTNSKFF